MPDLIVSESAGVISGIRLDELVENDYVDSFRNAGHHSSQRHDVLCLPISQASSSTPIACHC